MTADHKVLSEENKARLKHRCAVVVLDLFDSKLPREKTRLRKRR